MVCVVGAAWFSTFRPLGNTYLRSFSIGGNILVLGGDVRPSLPWLILLMCPILPG